MNKILVRLSILGVMIATIATMSAQTRIVRIGPKVQITCNGASIIINPGECVQTPCGQFCNTTPQNPNPDPEDPPSDDAKKSK